MNICKQCNREFEPWKSAVGKFCSYSCANESRRSQVKCTCQQCGKTFETDPNRLLKGRGKFCSRACSDISRHKQTERVCARCNMVFLKTPSQIKRGGGKYCSHECARKATKVECVCAYCNKPFIINKSELRRGGGKHCTKTCMVLDNSVCIELVCQHCGKFFPLLPGKVRPSTKFCSTKCRSDAKKTQIECNCVCCGKSIPRKPSRFARSDHKYCSHECYSKDKPNWFFGENTPRWLGGISNDPYCHKFNTQFKEKIRNKFDRRCFVCGSEENGRRLSVHHIDYAKNSICNGKAWAFVPLCASCHTKTNTRRYYWFNLMICYWAMNPETTFVQ